MARKSAKRKNAKRPNRQRRAGALVLERRNGVEVAVRGDDTGPPERRRHDRLEAADTLVRGRLARVRRTLDLVGRLHRSGAINGAQAAAGERFRADFDHAAFDPLQTPDLNRLRRRGRAYEPDLPDRVQDARDRVWRALNALGGHASPAGNAAWHLLGVGGTLDTWAEGAGGAEHRPLNPQTARGIVIAGLGVLAAHYGFERGRVGTGTHRP